MNKKNNNKRRAAFLIIYCEPFGDSLSERFLIATRWSGAYGFIGGEVNKEENIEDGLIRECMEEIGADFSNRKSELKLLTQNDNLCKNMQFSTYTLKISPEEIKKIWNEWRLNGEYAEYEISGLSLMRTEDEIIQNFKKNYFSGSSKKELEEFLKMIKGEK